MTMNGLICQMWESLIPHNHQKFSEEFLKQAKNYCRDPDKTGFPWCYTTKPGIRWDACEVDLCGL